MTEQQFWEVIESAWADPPEINSKRMKAVENNDEQILETLSGEISETILKNYEKRLFELDESELTDFIHILEEKLHNIDREEIHEYTDGSDDGFLYCRCFIVGMGKDYYEMIDKNPSKATVDLEAETFGFSAYQVYKEKFGKEFERNSVYNIESCTNAKGWHTSE